MKIALVHDYFNEYGGGERVLRVLADMYPQAPIYTAFIKKDGGCWERFKDRKVIESKWGWILKTWRLFSPLRFLIPSVWRGFDLSQYDVVITSCSGYIARGFRVGDKTKVIAYCHTPPRNLYGLQTSINWMGMDWSRFGPAKIYAVVINHFLRIFDYQSAQKVDVWLANSKNVKERIYKWYRRDAMVVYPPVDVEKIKKVTKEVEKKDYFLIVSRLVPDKGLVESAALAKKMKFKLRIVGNQVSGLNMYDRIMEAGGDWVGVVQGQDDECTYRDMAAAKGFLALARNEDFGMTVVESMAAGTPVLAFRGGGFKETVVDGKTGIFIDSLDEDSLMKGVSKLEKSSWNRNSLIERAEMFSREQFVNKVKQVVTSNA